MSKERGPIFNKINKYGRQVTYVGECYVQFISQIAIGTTPEEMGLNRDQYKRLLSFLIKGGIDVPTNTSQWGATVTERKVYHFFEKGNTTYQEAGEKLGMSSDTARAHVSNLRARKTYPKIKITRSNKKNEEYAV